MTTTAPQPTESQTLATGRVVAIAGPVIDVEFPPRALPEIDGAVEVDIELEGGKLTITAEVAQQIGDGRVRCICLKATDGLTAAPGGPQPRSRPAGCRSADPRARARLQRAGRAPRHRRLRR